MSIRRSLDLRFVQHRVGRAGGLGREFRRVAGDDAACVVPAAAAISAAKSYHEHTPSSVKWYTPSLPAIAAFDDREDRKRQVPGVGRSARLVEDHVQRLRSESAAASSSGSCSRTRNRATPCGRIRYRHPDASTAARPRASYARRRPAARSAYPPCRAVCRAVEDVVRRDVDQRRAVRLRGPARFSAASWFSRSAAFVLLGRSTLV